jgi:class 3 adenylate cyclase
MKEILKKKHHLRSLILASRPAKISETIIVAAVALAIQSALQIILTEKLGAQTGFFGIITAVTVTWFGNIKLGFLFSIIAGIFTSILVYGGLFTDADPVFDIVTFGVIVYSMTVLIIGVLRYLVMRLHNTEEKLRREYEKSNMLLHNILPVTIADRLKNGEQLIADRYENATILFCDLVGFTAMAENRYPEEIVKILNRLVSEFDKLSGSLGLEKIKTIGDAYLVVAGLPEHRSDHAAAISEMALKMIDVVETVNGDLDLSLKVRIGIHSGPVVGGVIGQIKFTFDLWGDTVNVAARLESHGIPGKIQISETTKQLLNGNYLLEERGEIELRNHSRIKTWFLEGKKTDN